MMYSSSSRTLLLVAGLAAASCSHPASEAVRQTVDAPVAVAETATLPSLTLVAGSVRARSTSTLAANLVGTVTRVRVSAGDVVRAGDILLEIDGREQRANAERVRAGGDEVERSIDAARANAELAQTTFRRFEALRQRGSASQQEFDEARTRNVAAQADLARLTAARAGSRAAVRQAEAVAGYALLRAPITGVVTARFVDPGAQAAPGVPLLAIEEEHATRVDATVAEDIAVRSGDRVSVFAGSTPIGARVVRIQPSVDARSRSALVELELDTPVRSGTYVKVAFPTGQRAAVVVPVAALVRRGQLVSVFVVGDNGIARMRLVTPGAADGSRTEILSGITPGETVVVDPSRVREGVVVRSAS